MKAQQLVQCMVPRALFGGVRNTSKSVYSSDSQLLLSRPSVSGAYLRNTQEKQLLEYQLYCFRYVAAVVFFFYRYQLYCFQCVAADVLSFFGLRCTVSSTYQVQCCRVAIICRLAYGGRVVKTKTKWYLAMTLGLQQQ